jgi:hypothetical protein
MRLIAACLVLASAGCGGTESSIQSVSHAGETLSHEPGTNCMGCHSRGGGALSWFTAAGTLLLKDGTVRTAGTVTLGGMQSHTVLEIDGLGNFFTTEDVGLPSDPVIPEVFDNATGKTTIMPFSTPSAACNCCHSGSNHFVLQ